MGRSERTSLDRTLGMQRAKKGTLVGGYVGRPEGTGGSKGCGAWGP